MIRADLISPTTRVTHGEFPGSEGRDRSLGRGSGVQRFAKRGGVLAIMLSAHLVAPATSVTNGEFTGEGGRDVYLRVRGGVRDLVDPVQISLGRAEESWGERRLLFAAL
jgi:hypothetical protein